MRSSQCWGLGIRESGRRIWDSGEEGELKRALQARERAWTVRLPSAGARGHLEPGVDDMFQTERRVGRPEELGRRVLTGAVLGSGWRGGKLVMGGRGSYPREGGVRGWWGVCVCRVRSDLCDSILHSGGVGGEMCRGKATPDHEGSGVLG